MIPISILKWQEFVLFMKSSLTIFIFAENTFKKGNIICSIKSGYARGGNDEEIGFKGSAEKCFRSIRKKRKNANGMTWEKRTHRCTAEFKANRFDKNCQSCQSCIFEGMV